MSHRKRKREQPRICQGCQAEGSRGITITFDPITRWWLCDNCLLRQRLRRSGK